MGMEGRPKKWLPEPGRKITNAFMIPGALPLPRSPDSKEPGGRGYYKGSPISDDDLRMWPRGRLDPDFLPPIFSRLDETKAEIKALREEIKSLVASMEEPEPQLPLALKSEFARILREGFEKNLPIEKIERQLRGEAHAYQNFLQRERRSNRRGREVRH